MKIRWSICQGKEKWQQNSVVCWWERGRKNKCSWEGETIQERLLPRKTFPHAFRTWPPFAGKSLSPYFPIPLSKNAFAMHLFSTWGPYSFRACKGKVSVFFHLLLIQTNQSFSPSFSDRVDWKAQWTGGRLSWNLALALLCDLKQVT